MCLIWSLVFRRRPLLPFSPLHGGSSGPKPLSELFNSYPHFGRVRCHGLGFLVGPALYSVGRRSSLSLFSGIQGKLSLRGLSVVGLCILNPSPGSTVLSQGEKDDLQEVTVVKRLEQAVIAQASLKLPILLPQPPCSEITDVHYHTWFVLCFLHEGNKADDVEIRGGAPAQILMQRIICLL